MGIIGSKTDSEISVMAKSLKTDSLTHMESTSILTVMCILPILILMVVRLYPIVSVVVQNMGLLFVNDLVIPY